MKSIKQYLFAACKQKLHNSRIYIARRGRTYTDGIAQRVRLSMHNMI